jgi:hypothetical protein
MKARLAVAAFPRAFPVATADRRFPIAVHRRRQPVGFPRTGNIRFKSEAA